MIALHRAATVGCVAAAILAGTAAPAAAQQVAIANVENVSERRITRTVSEFVYRLTVTNMGADLPGLTAVVASLSPATTIVDGTVSFGPLAANATVQSSDTFTFRHDRTVPFDFANLQWTFAADSNRPPVANAGEAQTVALGAIVQLDGSGSTDADGDPLTFAWTLIGLPAGSAALLNNASAVQPTFTADEPGVYIAELVVSDGQADSAPDTVTIRTDNSPPVAHAGADQTVVIGRIAQVDGSASSDPDGHALTFDWSITNRPQGSLAALANANSFTPSLTPDLPGTYVVQLVVNDGVFDSAPDTVVLSTENLAPTANTGADQSVDVGVRVDLDGSASHDPEGAPLQFSWSLTTRPDGSIATLENAGTSAPRFVTDQPGTYVAQLIVSDGDLSSAPDTVVITAELPVVTLVASDKDASEGSQDPAIFTVSRTGPTVAALAVDITIGGSAVNGVDYATIAATVTLPPGASSTTVSVTPIDDDEFELPETIVLTLVPSAAYTVGTTNPVTVGLADNDFQVNVKAVDALASEAGVDPGQFVVSRQGPTTSALAVFYTIEGSATNGQDYVSLPGQVVIAAGSSEATISLAPLDDAEPEGPEEATLVITANPAYAIGVGRASVTIADDERPGVSIFVTDDAAGEAGSNAGTFTVTRFGSTNGALTVSYSVAGDATNGADYQTIPGTVTIPAGSASATIAIAPIDDAATESPEAVVLVLEPGAGYVVVTPGIASLTIADNDSAIVTIEATDAEARETGPNTGTFTVRRTGGNLAAPLAVLVTRSGTADNGGDYQSLGGFTFIVAIPANAAEATITIAPLADTLVEDPETVILTIAPRVVYTIGQSGTATVTIADGTP